MSSSALSGSKKMVSMRLNLKLIDRVKKILKANDRTETVELALHEIEERARFRKYIEKTSGKFL